MPKKSARLGPRQAGPPVIKRILRSRLARGTGALLVTSALLAGTTIAALAIPAAASANVLYDGLAGLAAGTIPFPVQIYVKPHVTVVPDPLGGNFNVMKFAVPDSDRPYSGASNPRADFKTPAYYSNGSDLYTSIKFLEPASFPALSSSGFFQIMEIYGPPFNGSPAIGIDLYPGAGGRPVVSLTQDASHGYRRPWTSTPLDTGWHTMYLHTIMSTSETTGLVEIWLDGVKQSSTQYRTLGPSNYNGSANWLQVNQYRRAGAYPGTVVTYHAPAKVGTTLADVQDGGGGTTTTTAPPPSETAAFTGPATSKIGQAVTFDGSSSTGSPTSYAWTDADAKNVALGTGSTLNFTFHFAGTKKITLTTTYADGSKSTAQHDLVVS